ncbi:NAD-binding protein [Sanghuangporus baumii]|uniref:enoyl-[acyl-carrier-protein] reductase n=1 Tax=Sanghuangporus baumii TaxID=108892 RepID=A0A9Q5HUP6_SANBA|nr:NAD-binding protein [Sanghuangporus baumii]
MFSTNFLTNRAVVFTSNGDPMKVVRVVSFPNLPPPRPKSVNIRYILSPINPSDINVIEGVYPAKPEARADLAQVGPGSAEEPCFIAGNEGLAEVQEVGEGVGGLASGDRVVMVKPQSGTWSTGANVGEQDVIKVPKIGRAATISEVQGATMSVNPPTAYNMLNNFVELRPGDWIVQNGANSAVSAQSLWPGFSSLENELKELGATHVLPLELLSDRSARSRIKEVTGGANIRLALNCVSGPTTAAMVGLLGPDAHLVSYGAMSKRPLLLPTSAFIFKGLTAHGFMQNRWYRENDLEKREELMNELAKLMVTRKLREPRHMILDIPRTASDDDATSKVRDIIEKVTSGKGMFGRKVLLRFEN